MNSSEEQFPMLVLQDYPKHYLTPKKLLSEAIDFTHKQQKWIPFKFNTLIVVFTKRRLLRKDAPTSPILFTVESCDE